MKNAFTFLLVLMAVFLLVVMKDSTGVALIVKTPTPTSKVPGGHLNAATPVPPPTATPMPLPEHIWSPKLGTSYEIEKLGGVGNRFSIAEPQIFVSFAYINMEDDLPCTIAIMRSGEANGEMSWLWDTKLRSSQGRMVVDILSIIENLQPGDYALEISVRDQIEQRIEFELF